jgi:hypothetical protein
MAGSIAPRPSSSMPPKRQGPPHAPAGARAPAVGPLLTVRRRSWPGRLPGERVPDRPRTHQALAQVFGASRSHERRAPGRKVASPAVVRRGAVRRGAWAAIRLRPGRSEARAPDTGRAGHKLRHALETRGHQRTQRRRFRRAPASSLATLEADLLQLIVPP